MGITADWIAADWGTSRLRVWAMDAAGTPLAAAQSDRGMGELTPEGFEPALLALVAPWLADRRVTGVLVCGMAGARQGWAEAPYRAVPCAPVGPETVRAPTRDARLAVRILPGLSQAEPADVMRGEETQIAGFLRQRGDAAGTLCLPGTHAKWVRVAGGAVTDFRTAMTGELFALLGRQSVLRHALGDGWDAAAFDDAVQDALAAPESLVAQLFGVRARALLDPEAPPGRARARLSGLLIGSELAATRRLWSDAAVTLIGEPGLTRLYARALALAGREAVALDGAPMALAGLAAAQAMLREDP